MTIIRDWEVKTASETAIHEMCTATKQSRVGVEVLTTECNVSRAKKRFKLFILVMYACTGSIDVGLYTFFVDTI